MLKEENKSFLCPSCNKKMHEEARDYYGFSVYKFEVCKNCGEELVSDFEWDKNGQGSFVWRKHEHPFFVKTK